MSAKIIINKKNNFFFRNATFTVFFDGKEVALMANSKTFVLEDAGIYAVQVKMKWLKTQTLIVKVEDGKEVYLEINNGMKYYTILYSTFLISLLAGPLFFRLTKGLKPEWLAPVQLILALAFTAYTIFYFIFKRGEIWILEDANEKNKSR